jgi:histone-lysine N-methyltransferase SETD3
MDLKKDYDAVCYACEDFYQKYTFRDFCWARMMVGSRVFGVVIDGQKTEVLVPFADMLNHKVPKETVWNYSHEKKGFFIQSLKDINLG